MEVTPFVLPEYPPAADPPMRGCCISMCAEFGRHKKLHYWGDLLTILELDFGTPRVLQLLHGRADKWHRRGTRYATDVSARDDWACSPIATASRTLRAAHS